MRAAGSAIEPFPFRQQQAISGVLPRVGHRRRIITQLWSIPLPMTPYRDDQRRWLPPMVMNHTARSIQTL